MLEFIVGPVLTVPSNTSNSARRVIQVIAIDNLGLTYFRNVGHCCGKKLILRGSTHGSSHASLPIAFFSSCAALYPVGISCTGRELSSWGSSAAGSCGSFLKSPSESFSRIVTFEGWLAERFRRRRTKKTRPAMMAAAAMPTNAMPTLKPTLSVVFEPLETPTSVLSEAASVVADVA